MREQEAAQEVKLQVMLEQERQRASAAGAHPGRSHSSPKKRRSNKESLGTPRPDPNPESGDDGDEPDSPGEDPDGETHRTTEGAPSPDSKHSKPKQVSFVVDGEGGGGDDPSSSSEDSDDSSQSDDDSIESIDITSLTKRMKEKRKSLGGGSKTSLGNRTMESHLSAFSGSHLTTKPMVKTSMSHFKYFDGKQ